MIDVEDFYKEVSSYLGLWCAATDDSGELARIAEYAAGRPGTILSAAPDDVAMLWTWLENSSLKICARFYLAPGRGHDEKVISDLTARINAAFKQGARAAQIFMRFSDLPAFADEIGAVRDDLFFNRDLIIGLDVADVGPFEWATVFDILRKIRAGALVLVQTRDSGDRSDFVGRVYAALDAGRGQKVDLHFMLGNNMLRMEQAVRLVQQMRPEIIGGVRVFMNALEVVK